MVEILPEPSPEERAAILLALELLLHTTTPEERPGRSAWAAAGRHESRLPSIRSLETGWGRGSTKLADW